MSYLRYSDGLERSEDESEVAGEIIEAMTIEADKTGKEHARASKRIA